MKKLSVEHSLVNALGQNGFYFLGVLFFALMAYALYRTGTKKEVHV